MRWRLDDNERGAFNYLFGGVALVLVVRVLLYVVGLFGTPAVEEEGLAAFQHGYFLSGHDLMVVGTTASRMERIAFAVVLSVLAAVLLAALVAVLAKAIGRSPARPALVTGRWALLLFLGWSLYTALFVPVQSARVTGRALVERTYRMAVRDIPLPFTAVETTLTGDTISRIEGITADPVKGCDGRAVIQWIDRNEVARPLAERGGICVNTQIEALREAAGVAAALERGLH